MTNTTRWFDDGTLHFGVGIEDTFIADERLGKRKLDEYELTQHYQFWREDLRLAADTGAEYIRWGIPWYQVEPQEGVFDFTWIDEVVAYLDEIGLRCVVDLMHYGTPLWLENSFVNPRYPELVARYAREVARRYAGRLTDYTPLNEPIVNAIWCGRDAEWPPHLVGDTGFVSVLMPVVKGMVLTQRAILDEVPEATFVHVEAGFRWAGEHFPGLSHDELKEWRFLPSDLVMGRVTADHPMRGFLIANGAHECQLDWLEANNVRPDVLGVNYYPGFTTLSFDRDTDAEIPTEAGVSGLVDLIEAYAKRYDIPLAITETSRGSHDPEQQIAWIKESFDAVEKLRALGIPIVGYTWFPLLDLIDWQYRNGNAPMDNWLMPLGLVNLRRGADNVLHRVPSEAYRHFTNAVSAARG